MTSRNDCGHLHAWNGGAEIVKIKLGSKVPLAVICVLAPDVVCMKREECLVGRHARCTAVKQVHPSREVELRWS